MTPPTATQIARLPPDLFDWYQERAAIMEYDGNLPHAEAEAKAYAEVIAEQARRQRQATI